MRDKNGLSLHRGDSVSVQTSPDGPIAKATVLVADGDYCKRLNAVLVQFENETTQYMPPTALTFESRQ